MENREESYNIQCDSGAEAALVRRVLTQRHGTTMVRRMGNKATARAHHAEATPTARGNATTNITQLQRSMLAKCEVTYGVTQLGTLSSLQEGLGLARSHLDLTKQAVRIGEETTVTVDFQGLRRVAPRPAYPGRSQ